MDEDSDFELERDLKRRKGGLQQRLQAEKGRAAASKPKDSALAAHLEVAWAWGSMSPQQVQQIAALAAQDMVKIGCSDVPERLSRLAAIGSHGSHSNNCHRDLMALLAPKAKMPKVFQESIPFQAGHAIQSIMLPHEMFAALYNQHGTYWKRHFLPGGEGELVAFWNNFDSHPAMSDEVIRSKPNYKKTCIPVAIHGDSVPCVGVGKVWSKLMQVFSWPGVLCQGGSKATLFLLWSVFDHLILAGEGGTLEVFFKILKWSFTAMYHGKYPDRDWKGNIYGPHTELGKKAGRYLAGGFCGILVSIQGDLEWFAKSLQLPNWSSNQYCCPLCPCKGTGPMTWRNFKPDAAWTAHIFTPDTWRAWEARSRSPLFEIPGVAGPSVSLDLMHNKYLGSDMYALGGIWYYLCFYLLPKSPQENLAGLWLELQSLYKQLNTKHRYNYFNKLTMFVRKSGPPKLRGRAAEVKGMVEPMLHLWFRHHNPNILLHKQILTMLKLNVSLEHLLDEHKGEPAFPGPAAAKFKETAFKMAHVTNIVASHFHSEEDTPWICNVTAKLHMVLHSAVLARCINPRLVWNFVSEDFMGVARTLAANSVKGSKPLDAPAKLMEHWRIGMGLHMQSLEAL